MSVSYTRPDYEFNYYVLAGLIVSVLVHLAAVLLFNPLSTPDARSPMVVDVFYAPVPPLPPAQESTSPQRIRDQLVSPPEASSPPREQQRTALLSDRDSYAEREQVRRGDGLPAQIPGGPASKGMARSAPASQTETKPQRKEAPAPPLRELKLDEQTLLSEFGQKAPPTPSSPRTLDELVGGKAAQGFSRRNYQAFSRPSGSGAAFLGLGGTSDYLPNLPDGDITLLNTKATLFAVFVRRVATQVFAQLRSQGWGSLSPASIQAISGFARIRATLDPHGNLKGVELLGSSGSPRFDEVLAAAARAGARDPNPPRQAAAEDGNFHFIFEARSWVQMGVGPAGFPAERRWLLLSTGLE